MIWRFAGFEIDERRFELRRGGAPVPIAPKPLALLLYLARRHPASVSRDELLGALWPDVKITHASLSRAVRAARVALGEDADQSDGILRTVRGRGYALRGSLIQTATTADALACDGLPFVGRTYELLQLESALEHLGRGRGALVRISGEPGIGKSCLLEEVASRALSRGFCVVQGQCRVEEGAPPFWPWPEIAAAITQRGHGPSEALSEGCALGLGDLPRLEGEPRSAAEERFRVFQSLTTLLRRKAMPRPLVILVEDLHWARSGALDLLRFAARSLSNAPILLAVFYRDSGAPWSTSLGLALGELAGLPNALPELRLLGLSGEETAAYVTSATGAPPSPDLCRWLVRATAGNPLFLRELLPVLLSQRSIRLRDLAERLPAAIEAVLRDQTEGLSGEARGLVDLAAVIGRTGTMRLLARAAGLSIARAWELTGEARRQNLLECSREPDRFRFRHDLLRAAVYGQLSATRRSELHARVATALEGVAGAHAEEQLRYLV